jgi:hypothetical protein
VLTIIERKKKEEYFAVSLLSCLARLSRPEFLIKNRCPFLNSTRHISPLQPEKIRFRSFILLSYNAGCILVPLTKEFIIN